MRPDGILLVHKPAGMTSHDVVQVVRRKLGMRRVGHSGTLDPMAEGLLVLLVGGATKHQQAFQAHEKTYQGVLRLGTQTDTGDAMGVVVRGLPVPPLTESRIAAVLASFQGPFVHTPPAFSAVKVRGRPAYWWARRRQPVTLRPRVVQLSEIALVGWTADTVTFQVRCSAGTYVRTLAEAMAERLGTAGHLSGLIRLRVGRWSVEEARSFAWLQQTGAAELAGALLPSPLTVGAPPVPLPLG
jgi:tRNA pseudouridine55 synthase